MCSDSAAVTVTLVIVWECGKKLFSKSRRWALSNSGTSSGIVHETMEKKT